MPKRQFATAALGIVLLLGTLGYLAAHEQTAVRSAFTVAVTAAIAALIILVTRRILFAGFATAVLVAALVVTSDTMMQAMNISLHAYDFFFYLNWQTVVFLWSEYRSYLLAAVGALAVAVILSALIWRLDATRCPRRVSGVLLIAVTIAVAALTWPAYAERRPFQIFGPLHPISNFYLSWGETLRVLWNGHFIEAAAHSNLPAFAATPECPLAGKPPNIILIHHESLMPPNLFAKLDYDRSLDPFFLSDDRLLHKLHVETYGGASWLSEFSLLAGISSRSFGDMRPFLSVFMKNRLKATLPQILDGCGFRNLLFFPMGETFLALGKFYRTIGFDEIFDLTRQHAPTDRERDGFHYNNALDAMAQQFKSGDRPLFVYVQTMAAHGPYHFKFDPTAEVPGGGPGTPPDMNEFLRRMAMARIDYDRLVDDLKRRFPDQRFLIVRYGDHQPTATRSYLALPPHAEVTEDTAPVAFATFYAVNGVNYTVPKLPAYDLLDIAFLSTTLLEAAGIPLPDSYRERKRLMLTCNGRYYSCPRRDEILAFHRRLIDSNVVIEGN